MCHKTIFRIRNLMMELKNLLKNSLALYNQIRVHMNKYRNINKFNKLL